MLGHFSMLWAKFGSILGDLMGSNIGPQYNKIVNHFLLGLPTLPLRKVKSTYHRSWEDGFEGLCHGGGGHCWTGHLRTLFLRGGSSEASLWVDMSQLSALQLGGFIQAHKAPVRAFNAPGSGCSRVQARRLCGPPRMGCALCRSLYGVRGLVKFAVSCGSGASKATPVRVSTGAPLGRQSMVWIYGPWSFRGRRRRQEV